jgi:hypothetical protein
VLLAVVLSGCTQPGSTNQNPSTSQAGMRSGMKNRNGTSD